MQDVKSDEDDGGGGAGGGSDDGDDDNDGDDDDVDDDDVEEVSRADLEHGACVSMLRCRPRRCSASFDVNERKVYSEVTHRPLPAPAKLRRGRYARKERKKERIH